MPAASLILPFAFTVEEGNKLLTPDMEVAAVLLWAEAKRRKPVFFGTVAEKTVFVSKLHYPLWVVPWENGSLIVDGLDVFSATVTYQALPDVSSFINDVERGALVREQLWVSLEKHKQTFTDFAKSVEVKVDALISERELLSAVFEYVGEADSTQFVAGFQAFLTPPKLDVQAAFERAKQASRLLKQVQAEISNLEYARNLLRETANLHEQMILKEIKFTRKVYDDEVSRLKPAVEGKEDKLQRELEAKIARINRAVENKLRTKEGEREKRESELQRLELQKADFNRRRDAGKRKSDKIGLARWEHRIRLCENRIREVERRIRDLSRFIEETRRQNENEVEKLRSNYQELIDEERKEIASLEAERDENVESRRKEVEALKLAAGQIADQIEDVINRKRKEERELRELVITWHVEDASLICLPFYLVGYQRGGKTRLQIFPPCRVMRPGGVVEAFKKALAVFTPTSKTKLLPQPRSKALTEMLDFAIKERMNSDEAFHNALRQAASSTNILATRTFSEDLIKGLEGLRAQGWIGQEEADALVKIYVQGGG